MAMGIDLSLRSTSVVNINKNGVSYHLVTSSSKDLNDEKLLLYNKEKIKNLIELHQPDRIALEGLSFGSISSSKDILAGNFWSIRTMIAESFPDIELIIVPVTVWRSPLLTKEERKQLKQDTADVKELKKQIAKADKETKKNLLLANEELILRANIKFLTWLKVPEPLKTEFENFGFNKGCFDLTDGYFLASHIG
jgi:hypothetical protein